MDPRFDFSVVPKGSGQSVLYEYLRRKTSAPFRAIATRRFNQFFPKGHETSIRPLVQEILEHLESGQEVDDVARFMKELHPEMLRIIIRYGKDYAPRVWEKRLPNPKKGRCFYNSCRLAEFSKSWDGEPYVYVEGVVFGALIRPMPHAWNAENRGDSIAHDWTHYTHCRWSRYLGIPFTLDEYKSFFPDGPGRSIFHRGNFSVENKNKILSILEKREEVI